MSNKNTNGPMSNLMNEMKTKTFHQLNKGKGVTKNYAEFIVQKGLNEALEDINFSKTMNDFYRKITEKLYSYTSKAVFPTIISGFLFGVFNGDTEVYFSETQNRLLLTNNFNPILTKRFIDQYKKVIYEYIKNDESLLMSILSENINYKGSLGPNLTEWHINTILDQLFIDRSNLSSVQIANVRVIIKIIYEMQTLYTPNILFNNKDFVEFEMKNGYFRRYSSLLNKNEQIPSLQERIDAFKLQKDMSKVERTKLDDLSLLETRVSRLNHKYTQVLYSKLNEAKGEPNNEKRISIINECYKIYEIAYKEEIVNSLFTPLSRIEITKYTDLKNSLLNFFIATQGRYMVSEQNKDEINTTFTSPANLLTLPTSVGVGYDINGILPESILRSSSINLDLNKENNVVTPDNMFSIYSSPVSELKKSNKTKIVLSKLINNTLTLPSYVFVVLDGKNFEQDRIALENASMIADQNNLILVTFNLPKIKKSLQESNNYSRMSL